MRKTIFIIIGFCMAIKMSAQPIPTQAPVDSTFLKKSDNKYGLLKEPAKYIFIKNNLKKAMVFPAKYDMRVAGDNNSSLLTPVKNQEQCGSCWTFATMGALEAFALRTGLGILDLSENNLKECHGFSRSSCEGGNSGMSTAYLSRLSGPISEQEDPFYATAMNCKSDVHPLFYVNNTRTLSNDLNVLKQAIMENGAVYTNYYSDDAYYNPADYTYYYSGTAETNHAVLLVGWDDSKITNGGTGAWIIKNSWGNSWGENGYFYISYNDTKINSNTMQYRGISAIETNSYVFQYDKLGYLSSMGYSCDTAFALVKFNTGESSYILKQVSTYAITGNAVLGFEIFDNFDGTSLSNLIAKVQRQSCDLPGLYSFDLPEVQIAANNDFYVKVFYKNYQYNYPIPTENTVNSYAYPEIEKNVAWISYNGKNNWTAFGSDQPYKQDLCIRVFAKKIDSGSDIKNIAIKKEITVSPIPATDNIKVTINNKFSSDYKIDIYDISGKIVLTYNKNASDSEFDLDIKDAPTGVLMLRAYSQNQKIQTKILKK